MLSLGLGLSITKAGSSRGYTPQELFAFQQWLLGYGVIASGSWDQSFLWSDVETWLDTAPFVLAEGTWDRRGVWADTGNWLDTPPFVLATGTWNRLGIWADASTWNDGV